MKDTDLKRVETHLKRTFNHGGIQVKVRFRCVSTRFRSVSFTGRPLGSFVGGGP